MTWRELLNIRPVDFLKATFNNDLTAEGGYADQLANGSLAENGYVNAGGRILEGLDADGSGALGAYSQLASSGASLSGDQQQAFNNLMATEATNDARQFEEHMRDTDLLSSGSQLSSMGISPSTLAGATAHHSGVGAANISQSNPSLERYERRMSLAKSLIGLAGSMSSSAIYGANLRAVKAMAGKMATASANSAMDVTNLSKRSSNPQRKVSDKEWNALFEADSRNEDPLNDPDWMPF